MRVCIANSLIIRWEPTIVNRVPYRSIASRVTLPPEAIRKIKCASSRTK